MSFIQPSLHSLLVCTFGVYLVGAFGCSSGPMAGGSTATNRPTSTSPMIITPAANAKPPQEDIQPAGNSYRESDEAITTIVRNRLISPGTLPVDNVAIQTRDGIVTLTGTLENPIDRRRIVEIARSVPEANKIIDHLSVRFKDRPDQEILDDVRRALTSKPPFFRRGQIRVVVDHGVVSLRGKVRTWQQKDLASAQAADVQGVRQVKNEISFDQPSVARRRSQAAATIESNARGEIDKTKQ